MKRRWIISFLVFLSALTFVPLSILTFNIYQVFYQPMLKKSAKPVIFNVDTSMSATSFVNTLKARDFISSTRFFLFLIRAEHLSNQLKAGIYEVYPGESAHQFFNRVIAGDVLIQSFRIIEGTTAHKVSVNLAKAPYLSYRDKAWAVLSQSNPEGLLLADTYHYNAGSDATKLLIHAHKNLVSYLDDCWQHRAEGLPLKTPYELLIVASIIEKEAALLSEKRLIAGVVMNRLRKKMPLQMDPTVIYALGAEFKAPLTHDDLKIDSPYNTYRYKGLPPTPIAMVGKQALDAAAHPTPTDFLYFVAQGNGQHQFSVTYEQQQQAITRYLRKP
jgi:UPF0755 protein